MSDTPAAPTTPTGTLPYTQKGRAMVAWQAGIGGWDRAYWEKRVREVEDEAMALARSTPAEALDPLMPDSEVAEMLRKVIRQYHGTAHGGGSWLNCDDRWCADARAAQGAAAPPDLDVDALAEAMWAERDRLDAGIDGFRELFYRRAARAILARLSGAPTDSTEDRP